MVMVIAAYEITASHTSIVCLGFCDSTKENKKNDIENALYIIILNKDTIIPALFVAFLQQSATKSELSSNHSRAN